MEGARREIEAGGSVAGGLHEGLEEGLRTTWEGVAQGALGEVDDCCAISCNCIGAPRRLSHGRGSCVEVLELKSGAAVVSALRLGWLWLRPWAGLLLVVEWSDTGWLQRMATLHIGGVYDGGRSVELSSCRWYLPLDSGAAHALECENVARCRRERTAASGDSKGKNTK